MAGASCEGQNVLSTQTDGLRLTLVVRLLTSMGGIGALSASIHLQLLMRRRALLLSSRASPGPGRQRPDIGAISPD